MELVQLFKNKFLHEAIHFNEKNNLSLLKDNKAIYIIADNSKGTIISDDIRSDLQKFLSVYHEEKVFITLFKEKDDFANHSNKVSWGSYVWIASEPNHTIHFNSKPTLKPRKSPLTEI